MPTVKSATVEDEESPTDGSVTLGDQADQAERRNSEANEGHEATEHPPVDTGETLTFTIDKPGVDPFVDRVNEPCASFDHGAEKNDHKDREEPRGYLPKDSIHRNFGIENARIEPNDDQVEEETGKDSDHGCHYPGDNGFLAAIDVVQGKEDRREGAQVVEGVLEAAEEPALFDISHGKICADLAPDLGKTDDQEDKKDRVQEIGPP